LRRAPGCGGWARPAGAGRRSRAAAPASSAPPSRPSRPPNLHTARTRSAVSRELRRPATPVPRSPGTHPYFVGNPDRVHLAHRPSHPDVAAVSVSLRHHRNSVTLHRPPPASRRSATGRTMSPFSTTVRYRPGQDRRPDLQGQVTGRVQEAWRRGTLPVRANIRSQGDGGLGRWLPNLAQTSDGESYCESPSSSGR
jgi:hypothetical protein